jgi:voltage-gated potassium channel
MTEAPTGWGRPVASLVGLLVAYYAFPADWSASVGYLALSLLLTGIGLSVLGRIMVLELQHVRAGVAGRSAQVLTTVLVLLVMSFSLAAYLLQELFPGQFVGISTRTDALYFTLSTMTTVGYGDDHAEGQLARALVCGLIVFNVVVVASLLRAHTRVQRAES